MKTINPNPGEAMESESDEMKQAVMVEGVRHLIEATQPNVVTSLDVRKKHEQRLRILSLMASVVNEVKTIACSGMMRLNETGVLTQAAERYLFGCTRKVPDLGVRMILTRDESKQLRDNLHCGYYLHLGLLPMPASETLNFKALYPEFVQLTELDDTSARDWVTTAFAPHESEAWEERMPDGTRNFRLFTTRDFSQSKKLWANQSRSLRQVLGWRQPYEVRS